MPPGDSTRPLSSSPGSSFSSASCALESGDGSWRSWEWTPIKVALTGLARKYQSKKRSSHWSTVMRPAMDGLRSVEERPETAEREQECIVTDDGILPPSSRIRREDVA